MTVVPRHLVDGERGVVKEGVEPKDAATLIVFDAAGEEPKVLLGRRHMRHSFMPGKYVFPGGRVESGDRGVAVAAGLRDVVAEKLLAQTRFTQRADAEAFGLAAVRETFEETGQVIGRNGAGRGPTAWDAFFRTGFLPDMSALQLIGRAITPPGFPRRFDARFLAVEHSAIVHRVGGVVHADAELVELVWLTISEASRLDLPLITGYMLDELRDRLDAGFDPELPVPFYDTRGQDFTRALIG